jgi:predicted dehydrogenase/nucleoside-diphosphate-sugar epimerase
LQATAGASCTALFDVDAARAEGLRKAYFPEAEVVRTLEEIAGLADAAVIAVPNAYHAPASITLLRAGLHVLCEKPLATSLKDAEEMAAAAESAKRILSCGLIRRFYNSTALVSTALERGLVGHPLRFEITESVWNWPMSRATFDPVVSGGGMLIDIAPHLFDLIRTWFGEVEIVEYRDDSHGGVEADCYVNVRCKGEAGEISGDIFLSRSFRTPNRVRIFCSQGFIDVDPHRHDQIRINFGSGDSAFPTTATSEPADPFTKQMRNFVEAVRGKGEPLVSARDAVETIALVERCYNARAPLELPWTEPARVYDNSRLDSFKKILVTGAAGGVGSRMVEMWAERGRLGQLKCMVRSYRTAGRIMRYPLEIAEADLLDREALGRALEGCDAVVHLGVGEKAGRETEAVVEASQRAGVRRFVHLSSASVYGRVIPSSVEELQEETKTAKTGEPYADEKAQAERVVERASRKGLRALILRPHIVYGPAMRWSAELMSLLAEGKVALVDGGGWGNLIYVDDLVDAIESALLAERGFGEPLFITDGAPIRWSDYITAHARLIGATPEHITREEAQPVRRSLRAWVTDSARSFVPVLRTEEFRNFFFESPAMQATAFRLYLTLRNRSAFRPYLERLRGGGGAPSANQSSGNRPFDEMWTVLQLSEARLSAKRAEERLGFRARTDFAEGLRRTATWFARYGLMCVKD